MIEVKPWTAWDDPDGFLAMVETAIERIEIVRASIPDAVLIVVFGGSPCQLLNNRARWEILPCDDWGTEGTAARPHRALRSVRGIGGPPGVPGVAQCGTTSGNAPVDGDRPCGQNAAIAPRPCRRQQGGSPMRRRVVTAVTGIAMLGALTLAPAAASAAQPGAGTCSGGAIPAGTYRGFIVTGTCTIAHGANVQINGNLLLARGASLNDHGLEAYLAAQIHITGNVIVGKGAVLGLGYNAAEGTLGPDTVGGSIIADQPLALQVGNLTVGGSVISFGGGVPSNSVTDSRNFPVKDNVIHGSLILQGWRGGWLGVIRDHVDGNVIVSFNKSISTPPSPDDPGATVMDPDSTEVQTNSIGGNLICFGNTPPAQVNPGDGGLPNVVGGHAIGECAGLTQSGLTQ